MTADELTRKPSHLRPWVWAQYRRLISARDPWESEPLHPTHWVHSKILSDHKCEIVWKAIERRRPEACQIPAEQDTRSHVLDEVLGAALSAWAGPRSEYEAATVTQRERIGNRVAQLAEELIAELKVMRAIDGTHGIPDEISDAFARRMMAASRYGDRHGANPLPTDPARAKSAIYWRSIGFHRATALLPGVLRPLARGARRWAASIPLVRRPKGANPERPYFMRTMTLYFRSAFGTPLYEAVAALTCAVYDCNVSADTVRKVTVEGGGAKS